MNIDEMVAGREMDTLIAEKVMGCIVGPCDGRTFKDTAERENYRAISCAYGCNSHLKLEDYSTSIAWAWDVVEKFVSAGVIIERDDRQPTRGKWYVLFGDGCGTEADTAPLAICRAALKAVMVKQV